MAEELTEDVADRLEDQLGTNRTVYRGGVPDDPDYPYLVVRSNVGETTSDNLGFGADRRTTAVWVTSVSKRDDAIEAAREASSGSAQAVDALVDYRFSVGQATWLTEHVPSQPPQRDDDLKPDVVFFQVDQFLIPYQP